MEIGSFIRSLREEQGLPIRKLAAVLDMDTSTLSKIERNERSFSLKLVPNLAKALKKDYRQLKIQLLTLKILKDFKKEDFAAEALKQALEKLK